MAKEKINRIGRVHNYYGGLHVKKEDNQFFWAIENWDGFHWEEIPKHLYDYLKNYEKSRIANLTNEQDNNNNN